jgi:hypothetical protein
MTSVRYRTQLSLLNVLPNFVCCLSAPVFVQGDAPTSFFVVFSGHVNVHKQDHGRIEDMANTTANDIHTLEMYGDLLGSLGPGDAFGEMGLLENKGRCVYTVHACVCVVCWGYYPSFGSIHCDTRRFFWGPVLPPGVPPSLQQPTASFWKSARRTLRTSLRLKCTTPISSGRRNNFATS